jgi:competence ComEA-like helix-hairpin-helix protein
VIYEEPVIYLPTVEPYADQDPIPGQSAPAKQTPVVEEKLTTPSSPDSTGTTDESGVDCVNINTASKEELTILNGVGDSTAEKIIQGRPYTQVEDLLNVSGIGEATLAKFEDMACI